jgi:hypothetical protein
MLMERISVRLDPRLKQQIEAEAREQGASPSDIVRQPLKEHMQKRRPQESAYDLAKRLGILGSAKGLPTDLSTNPNHMEGFGRN